MEETERRELQKFRLNSAGMGGLVVGALVSGLAFLADIFKENEVMIQVLGVAEFVFVCYGLYFFTRSYVVKTADYGVSFGKALVFQILLSAFASVLIGLATYTVMFVISPDYYYNLYKDVFIQAEMGEEAIKSFSELYSKLGSAPFIVVIYSMVGTIIKWFFPAMIISAFANKYFRKAE